jgi:hypothetical protein
MPDEDEEIVSSIGWELVSRLAPAELPLYSSLAAQLGGKQTRYGKASSDDQILGFGVGEAVVLLTPMILQFAKSFWEALAAQAAQASVLGVLDRYRRHRGGQPDIPRMTDSQLQLVRKIAEQQARILNVPAGQAGLLADALVGVLTGPLAS